MLDERFRRRLAEGEVLFRAGDPGDCAYVVEAGQLEVSVDRDGQRDVLAEVGPGALLGEVALLDNGARMATVTATAPSVLRVLTRRHLGERLDAADPLLRHILHLLTARFRGAVARRGSTGSRSPLPSEVRVTAEWQRDEDQMLAIERLRLEQEMELALENGEFVLHYQPIMRLEDETVAGFEALIRWRHPQRGLLMPSQFIPVAEQSDLISRIGHWTLRAATEALSYLDAARPAAGEPPLFMTVNLSGRQFSDPQLVPVLTEALHRSGVGPGRLLLEITESSLLDRLRPAARLMRQCEALGVRLSVDDFGTGYSALSYLYRLPVSSVKFARAFIRDLTAYPVSQKVVGAVTHLARELAMDTICEGVETAAQAAVVRTLGVRYAQGFFYAGGMPLPLAAAFLQPAVPPHLRRAAVSLSPQVG